MSEESCYNQLEPAVAYIHGACLVFLDGLGAGKVVSNLVSCIPHNSSKSKSVPVRNTGLTLLF